MKLGKVNKFDEQILVVERDVLFEGKELEFQGYRNLEDGDKILAPMEKYLVKRRGDMEEDNTYKQLITYAVIVDKETEDVLIYERLQAGGEKRLNGSLSIGVGGHTNEIRELNNIEEMLKENALRELNEELHLGEKVNPKIIGFVNNDADEVGEVHFGVVYGVEVSSKDKVSCRETDVLAIGWATREELKTKDNLEAWSKLIVEG